MVADAGPQTHRAPLPVRDKLLLHHRRHGSIPHSARVADACRRSRSLGYIQQAVLNPRDHHGLLLPGAGRASGAGELPDTSYDRARDVAFPKINLLSWYLFVFGGCFELYSMIFGGVDTGWTFTTPLSTHYLNSNVVSAAMGIFIAGFSSILTGLNFIVTIHRMRAPGMIWFRLPLFVWSYYATSIIFVLATPVNGLGTSRHCSGELPELARTYRHGCRRRYRPDHLHRRRERGQPACMRGRLYWMSPSATLTAKKYGVAQKTVKTAVVGVGGYAGG